MPPKNLELSDLVNLLVFGACLIGGTYLFLANTKALMDFREAKKIYSELLSHKKMEVGKPHFSEFAKYWYKQSIPYIGNPFGLDGPLHRYNEAEREYKRELGLPPASFTLESIRDIQAH